MLTSSISRCVAGGGPSGISLGSWLKSVANRWFGGAKPIIVGAKSSTVPLTSSVAQSQNFLIARWNFAERWNQYSDRSRLINLYTRQYRSFVLPSPRARLRGFGTLFGFVAFAPAMRNVDSKDESGTAGYEEETDYSESSLCQFAKRNVTGCQIFTQPRDADVQKLDDLHILRRATSADGDAWVLRGSLGAFMAKRNRVVDAIRIEEVTNECFSESQSESFEQYEGDAKSMQFEAVNNDNGVRLESVHLEPTADLDSASNEYSIVEEDSVAECNNLAMDLRVFECDVTEVLPTANVHCSRNEKSLYNELREADNSRDYSVISDETTQDQVPFLRFDAARISPASDLPYVAANACQPEHLIGDVAENAFDLGEMGSVGETIFECGQPRRRCLPNCDIETHSIPKVKMRNDSITLREAAVNHVAEWLNCSRSASFVSTESETSAESAASDGTLLRTLHETAEYFVYAFADHRAIPSELMQPKACALDFKSAWHLVLPHFSVLRVPMCSVLSDQLIAAHCSRFGAVRFDATPAAASIRAASRTRLENAGGIIRCLCTLATLKRGDNSENVRGEAMAQTPMDAKEFYLVVRQRPVPFRSFLRQLELEVLESRALSNSFYAAQSEQVVHSSVRWFDSVVLQLLEFGWAALVADRLRFISPDFEQLIDALGVEVDAFNTPRVVLLGDVDSYDGMFSPTRAHARSTRESFAAFAFVVYLNVSHLVEALELAGRLEPKESSARYRLVCSMYAAREENVGDLRAAMENLREAARLNRH